jgi:hypothetical protein
MDKGLDEYLDEFGENAKLASEIARNLGLGAIAVIWIFKQDKAAHLLPDRILVWALLFAVMSLGVDLLHYLFKSIALYAFYKQQEHMFDSGQRPRAESADVHAPAYIEVVSWSFFGIKTAAVVCSYVLITIFLIGKL